jgi:hypothetical protein
MSATRAHEPIIKQASKYCKNRTSTFEFYKSLVVNANVDTIRIDLHYPRFNKEKLSECLKRNFQPDTNNKDGKRQKHKSELDRLEFNLMKSGYSEFYFFKGKPFLSLFLKPQYAPKMAWGQILFHQTHIGSIRKLFNFLRQVFGYELAYEIIVHGIISRLDTCIDLRISLQRILSHSNRQGVQKVITHIGKKDTAYYGASKPHQIAIYEKSSWVIDKYVLTRIEDRKFNSEVPIKHLIDLPKLLTIPQFTCFKLYDLDEEAWSECLKRSGPLIAFDSIRRAQGYVSAKYKLSHQKNFKRIKESWESCSYPIDLHLLFCYGFETNLGTAFSKNFDLNPKLERLLIISSRPIPQLLNGKSSFPARFRPTMDIELLRTLP